MLDIINIEFYLLEFFQDKNITRPKIPLKFYPIEVNKIIIDFIYKKII